MDIIGFLVAIPVTAAVSLFFGWIAWIMTSVFLTEKGGFWFGIIFACLTFLSIWFGYFDITFFGRYL